MKERALLATIFISNFINKGHERSIRTKKNILNAFIVKGSNVIVNLMLIPLTINYVSATQYGIWVTLVSIVGWFSFFDIGFGNGLRNKFAQAIAQNEHTQARIYLSSAYAILTIIAATLLAIFLCINPFLNWSKILNAPENMAVELSLVALLVFAFFCLQFVLQLITTVITADQKFAQSSLLNLISNFISLLIIFILTKTTSGKLIYLALSISTVPFLVLLISSLLFYTHQYKIYSPSLKYVNLSYARNIASLSFKFFIIQISGILIYSTDNIIITHLYSPRDVIPYNAAFRYFSLVTIIFSIIIGPFWSAITEAYSKEDLIWIRRSVKQLFNVAIGLCGVVVIMFICSKFFYEIWLGDKIKIPTLLSFLMGIYFMLSILVQPFTFFINATGYIKIQLIQSIIVATLNIPLAVYFAKDLDLGVSGIILATIACFAPGAILAPLQYKKIITKKAAGNWIK